MYNILNNKFLFVFFVFLSVNAKVDKTYVQQNAKRFKSYLEDLQKSMSLPTFVINRSMGLLGYSKEEIDAVPAAFPFIYKEGYKKVLEDLNDDVFIAEANQLIDQLTPLFEENISKHARRQKAHELIHKWNCEKMNLDPKTTTKQLATFVENKKIDLSLFFHLQLIQFFVKYHLDIN